MEVEQGLLITGAISVALGGLAWLQWNISHRHQVRQRDAELLRWGKECILLMAELERHCSPVSSTVQKQDQARVEMLVWTSSALVDQGRLFFSNVAHSKAPSKSHGLRAFSGYRPAILDEILKAHYAARYLGAHGQAFGRDLRQHVWTARGRFVTELQQEMGPSVKRMPGRATGKEFSSDPTTWLIELDPEHMDPSFEVARGKARRPPRP
jgi:hypothetical protein